VSQVPGGRVAEVFSAKWILFASVALNIVATILTPLAAKLHWSVLILLRIIEGVGGVSNNVIAHIIIKFLCLPIPPQVHKCLFV
jgi:ACS family sodium-dependent inorganic phosphate cotransporter